MGAVHLYCVRMYPGIQSEVMKTAIGLVISGVLLLAGLRGDGAARAQDSCSIAYNCYAGLGCTVDIWLERHIPNYLPIAVEGGEWTEQGIKRGNIILPIGIASPPPEDSPEPPYP